VRTRQWIAIAVIALVSAVGFLGFVSFFLTGRTAGAPDLASIVSGGGRQVGLVRVFGTIADAEPVVDLLDRYAESDPVRAVVLRIESPGGGVAASQEIHEAVLRVRAAGKPVIASMGAIAASGGYYVAAAADTIVANPGTLTGSIGVIMSFPMFYELVRKAGIGFEVIKTGEHKDIGSPVRPMTDDERRLLLGVLDDVLDQFVEAVAEGRAMDIATVRALADGRIFSGRQARDLGLVDVLGDLDEAIRIAGVRADIRGEPVVVEPRKRRIDLLDLLTGAATRALGSPIGEFRLEYRVAR